MRRLGWLVGLGVAGCGGVPQDEFTSTYVDHYCEVRLDCGASATEVFDGLDSQEDCVALQGPEITAAWQGCKYKKKRAKQCLEQLPDPVCPESGEPAAAFPPICGEVFDKCAGG